MPLLNISHQPQQQLADCLAACSAMVLDFVGINIRYRRLLRTLKITGIGASFYNLQLLTNLGVNVTIGHGSMGEVESKLLSGNPVIVHVDTQELTYWGDACDHVIVVIGFDDQTIIVNDPVLANGGKHITRVEFELAWLGGDYQYATIEA